jgi:hypothetical protein
MEEKSFEERWKEIEMKLSFPSVSNQKEFDNIRHQIFYQYFKIMSLRYLLWGLALAILTFFWILIDNH